MGDANGAPDRPEDDRSHRAGPVSGGGDTWKMTALAPILIETPLDFLMAEHHRQREAARILLMIARGEFNRAGIRNLIDFLETDFAFHIADEELGLFPLLRRHCRAEDNIDELITRLAGDHREDEISGAKVTVILKDAVAGRSMSDAYRRKISKFAEHIRQHIAIENAALLPIARARLDDEALGELSKIMREHR